MNFAGLTESVGTLLEAVFRLRFRRIHFEERVLIRGTLLFVCCSKRMAAFNSTDHDMSKILTLVTAVALLVAFAAEASAGKGRKHHSQTQGSMTTGQSRSGYTGGNAALQGNNGNSGQGSNSLGNIKSGNIGGGK